ncbi:PREDICTED: uncharacterized protein LOC104606271 [Nelumbo nucifera]|uniref:Uncharacterized protein LOC104606271 n=1 Tax=Nelumbo nucifera TaxID=4432 RepID=A0A1U8APX8_NELNU|nr:PREDICTED: uncharacterized protein LOC104606271 [Nelumbo nucifera]
MTEDVVVKDCRSDALVQKSGPPNDGKRLFNLVSTTITMDKGNELDITCRDRKIDLKLPMKSDMVTMNHPETVKVQKATYNLPTKSDVVTLNHSETEKVEEVGCASTKSSGSGSLVKLQDQWAKDTAKLEPEEVQAPVVVITDNPDNVKSSVKLQGQRKKSKSQSSQVNAQESGVALPSVPSLTSKGKRKQPGIPRTKKSDTSSSCSQKRAKKTDKLIPWMVKELTFVGNSSSISLNLLSKSRCPNRKRAKRTDQVIPCMVQEIDVVASSSNISSNPISKPGSSTKRATGESLLTPFVVQELNCLDDSSNNINLLSKSNYPSQARTKGSNQPNPSVGQELNSVANSSSELSLNSLSKSQVQSGKSTLFPSTVDEKEPSITSELLKSEADTTESLTNEQPPSKSCDIDKPINEIAGPLSFPRIDDLSILKLGQLRERAKGRGLKGYTKLPKAMLIDRLKEVG